MQWGQIKTLFILCFLVLDIFLLHHFINNPRSNIELTEDVPQEENLRNNVNGLDNLPSDPPVEEAMLYAEQKELSGEDVEAINALPEQSSVILDNHLIISRFNEPLDVDIDENPEAVGNYIWHFEEYSYFGKDEETNTHIYFQNLERPIYFNHSAVILVQENEQGQPVNYLQTGLAQTPEPQEEEEINHPFAALDVLYSRGGYINSGDEITSEVTLGYHNLLPLPNGVQVLAPTWEFEVNEDEYFYVNAFERHITARNTSEFIDEMRTQTNQYFSGGSSVDMQAADDSWDEEQVDEFLEELINQFQEIDGVE
ncbi:two-component system regulatory protein YycI [Gracilibacillus timonensis]|uniref:two-component system regulatory protein YycI n=1 Tax=Gracilibacillus timonensis TaxID=1816696 RepID=UPI0008255E81|nr:two-component system regulatory protein YycI [Gracilibacillus timonensis]